VEDAIATIFKHLFENFQTFFWDNQFMVKEKTIEGRL
jgi:hypothetical protein